MPNHPEGVKVTAITVCRDCAGRYFVSLFFDDVVLAKRDNPERSV